MLLVAVFIACEARELGDDAGCTEDCLANGYCYVDGDCDVEELCYDSRCSRESGCKDADASTDCPTSCVGVCANAFSVGYCASDEDCAQGACRTDDRFCLRDRRADVVDCVGWCVAACFLAPTAAIDPDTGTCYRFADLCIPPGFAQPRSDDGCLPL
jgi:hypothetical protein